MWHDMFALPVPVAEKILRALFVYLFLVIALRLAGKRELAQLSTFDFVVLLSVANAVQNGIIGNDDSITGAWIGAMTLFVANFALAFAIVRSKWLRSRAEGQPTTLMKDGDVLRRQPRRAPESPISRSTPRSERTRSESATWTKSTCIRTAASRSRLGSQTPRPSTSRGWSASSARSVRCSKPDDHVPPRAVAGVGRAAPR